MMSRETIKIGNKSGKRYPKLNLEKTLKYTKRLITKTKTTAKPRERILTMVFDSKTWLGIQRLSSTKQYGLIEGSSKAMSASGLAKDIFAAPKAQRQPFLQKACLNSEIFNKIYQLCMDKTVSSTQISEHAVSVGVNPSNADDCAKNFIDSLTYADLAIWDGEGIKVGKVKSVEETVEEEQPEEAADIAPSESSNQETQEASEVTTSSAPAITGNINVNIELGSSMDPDKLEKCLQLLKTYGAI